MSANQVHASAPSLQPGQCISDPLSKNYLVNVRSSTSGAFDKMIAEIGIERFKSLRDSQTEQFYFCQATCANARGQLEKVWITQSDNPSNFANMNGFLCHSVTIEKVVIVGSITSPQPVATVFEAFNSQIPELHKWLRASDFRLSVEATNEQWRVFEKTADNIAVTFVNSGSVIFAQAGAEIWEIAHRTERGKLLLEEKMKLYTSADWQLPQEFHNPDYFVYNTIKTFGRFLQYQTVIDK